MVQTGGAEGEEQVIHTVMGDTYAAINDPSITDVIMSYQPGEDVIQSSTDPHEKGSQLEEDLSKSRFHNTLVGRIVQLMSTSFRFQINMVNLIARGFPACIKSRGD